MENIQLVDVYNLMLNVQNKVDVMQNDMNNMTQETLEKRQEEQNIPVINEEEADEVQTAQDEAKKLAEESEKQKY